VRIVPKRSQAHLDAQRRRILDASRRVFAHHGYEGATVARLEQATGLSRGAIFNYFESKWGLFFALAQEDQERAGRLWLDEGFESVVRWLGEQRPEWLGVYLEIARKLRTEPKLREAWEQRNPQVERLLLERLRELQERGEIRDDVDATEVARFLGVVLDGLALAGSVGVTTNVGPLLLLVESALAPQVASRTP
jgi:AcrR family transcriptional regulator